MPPSEKSWVSALPWAFLFGGFALYGAGAAPGLSILDSGEFLGVAATLGVAHPTGYPLYALLGQLATLFPWGGQPFLINLVSAAAAAGAAFFVALAAGELARQLDLGDTARALAIAAAGLLVLAGRTLWSVATMAEVYALNAFFWGALLWAAVRLRRTGAPRELYVLALTAGLSLANHATIVLFFPPLVLIGWPGRARARALVGALPLAAVLFLGGVSVNLYTPLRAAQKPVFNWNDPSTLASAYAHVAASQYRGHILFYGAGGVKEALSHYGGAAPFNVTPLAAFAAAALVWLFLKRQRAVALALILYYGGYLGYCLVYSIPDIHFYFIPLYLTVVFAAGLGVGAAARVIGDRFTKARSAVAICAAAAIVSASIWAFASNFSYGHRRGFIFAETYGRRLLAVLPARALFFSSADTNTFIACYDVYVRELRPDVAVVAQIRLAAPGYLTALARRNPGLIIPKEVEFRLLAQEAISRGEFPAGDGVILSSDDFVLPEVVGRIIAENAGRRRIFWGLGDPGWEQKNHIIPYDLVMEVVVAEPRWDEIARRGEASVAALTNLTASVERERPAELNDPAVRGILDLYYVGLSNHLLNWDIIEPQEKLFKSYVRLVPDDEEGYKNLAGICLLKGRTAEAVEYYRRALELAPADAVTRARLARALLASGQIAEAAETVETLPEEGMEGEGDYVRALIYRGQGKIKKALAAFKSAEPYLADDGEFWWERGLTYEAAGDYGAAVEAFDKALTFGPAVPPIYTARGESYLRMGNDARAKADFEAAISLNPGDAIAHYELACIYADEGRTADALEHLEAAVRVDPAFFVPAARADPDFENYRALPRFERIIKEYGGPAEP
jgi:tetratricopeptide (TPR) repeat protein